MAEKEDDFGHGRYMKSTALYGGNLIQGHSLVKTSGESFTGGVTPSLVDANGAVIWTGGENAFSVIGGDDTSGLNTIDTDWNEAVPPSIGAQAKDVTLSQRVVPSEVFNTWMGAKRENVVHALTSRVYKTDDSHQEYVRVFLVETSVVHILRRSHPRYQAIYGVLTSAANRQTAQVLIRATNVAEILDVQQADDAVVHLVSTPPQQLATTAVTPARAVQLFKLLVAQSCVPADPAAPCIPFMSPDFSSCNSRAEAACRILLAGGAAEGNLRKLWVFFGGETGCVLSHNDYKGWMSWYFHVAPTIDVVTPPATEPETWVFDPALFPETPVLADVWINFLVPENELLRPKTQFTEAGVYLLKADGTRESDPGDVKLSASLQAGRNALNIAWTTPTQDGTLRQPPYKQLLRANLSKPECS